MKSTGFTVKDKLDFYLNKKKLFIFYFFFIIWINKCDKRPYVTYRESEKYIYDSMVYLLRHLEKVELFELSDSSRNSRSSTVQGTQAGLK